MKRSSKSILLNWLGQARTKMSRFKNHLIAAAGFALLAAIGTAMSSHPAAGQGNRPKADTVPLTAPVTVVNIPLPVQGMVGVNNFPPNQQVSGAVKVNNFPATQPVSGAVAVNNFPATQPVSGTVAVSSLPPFSFSNTGATPLYIRDVDNAAHNPFIQTIGCTTGSESSVCGASFSVPSGVEFVIETAAMFAKLNSGNKAIWILGVTSGGTTTQLYLPLTFQGTFGDTDFYLMGGPLRVYADPGTGVSFEGYTTDSTGGETFLVTLSGYTVACGSGTGCPLP